MKIPKLTGKTFGIDNWILLGGGAVAVWLLYNTFIDYTKFGRGSLSTVYL